MNKKLIIIATILFIVPAALAQYRNCTDSDGGAKYDVSGSVAMSVPAYPGYAESAIRSDYCYRTSTGDTVPLDSCVGTDCRLRDYVCARIGETWNFDFSDSACTDGSCLKGECVRTRDACSDGTKNQDETDVDCGGSHCPKCLDNRRCLANSDCTSSYCNGGICRIESREQECVRDDDCEASEYCMDGECRPSTTVTEGPAEETGTCSDGIKNRDEQGIDCGGAFCNMCYTAPPTDNYPDCMAACDKYILPSPHYFERCKQTCEPLLAGFISQCREDCSATTSSTTDANLCEQHSCTTYTPYQTCYFNCSMSFDVEGEDFLECMIDRCKKAEPIDEPAFTKCKANCGQHSFFLEVDQCILDRCVTASSDIPPDCVSGCKNTYSGNDDLIIQCIGKCSPSTNEKDGAGNEKTDRADPPGDEKIDSADAPGTEKIDIACPRCECAAACEAGEYRCNGNSKKVLICQDGSWTPDADYEGYCVTKTAKTAESKKGWLSVFMGLFGKKE